MPKRATSSPQIDPISLEQAAKGPRMGTAIGFPRYWRKTTPSDDHESPASPSSWDEEEWFSKQPVEEPEELEFSFGPFAGLRSAFRRNSDRIVTIVLASLTTLTVLLIAGVLSSDGETGSDAPAQTNVAGETESAVVSPPLATPTEPPASMDLTVALAIAHDRVVLAVPETHILRFEGMSGVEVSYGGAVWGTTPFSGLVPDTHEPVVLRFERDGHRFEEREVGFSASSVEVSLRRRRPHRDRSDQREPPPPRERPHHEGPPPGLFGGGPLSGHR